MGRVPKYADIVLDILNDIVDKLQNAPVSRTILNPIDNTSIDRGIPLYQFFHWPGIYVDLDTTEQTYHTLNEILLVTNINIVIGCLDENSKDGQTYIIQLVGDVFETLCNLDSTELGGASRLTIAPDIDYYGVESGSGWRRLAMIHLTAEKSFIDDTG